MMTAPYRLAPVHRFPWLNLSQGYTALAAWLARAAGAVEGRPPRVAIDGFSGVRWAPFIAALTGALQEQGMAAPLCLSAEGCLQPEDALAAHLRPFLTDDPVFGRLYRGHLAELWDWEAVEALRRRLDAATTGPGDGPLIVYGPGAAGLAAADLVLYVDVPKDAGQALAAAGEIFPWAAGSASRST